jgi:hypothetical protein
MLGMRSMTRGPFSGAFIQHLERLFEQGTATGLSEGELLERFVRGRDESAFEALIARHGPMVLGVCRDLLRDPNDVDDAFQATFLVLVRKAGTLRRCDLLGNGCMALPTEWRPGHASWPRSERRGRRSVKRRSISSMRATVDCARPAIGPPARMPPTRGPGCMRKSPAYRKSIASRYVYATSRA